MGSGGAAIDVCGSGGGGGGGNGGGGSGGAFIDRRGISSCEDV